MFNTVLLTIAKITSLSISRRTDNAILLSLKKKKNNEAWSFVTTWMALEGIMLSELNQRKASTI